MARSCAGIVKAVDELTFLKELLPVAFFMDGLAIKHFGTQIGVQCRGFAVEYPVDQCTRNHLGNGRATGYIDHGFGLVNAAEAIQRRFNRSCPSWAYTTCIRWINKVSRPLAAGRPPKLAHVPTDTTAAALVAASFNNCNPVFPC